MRARVGRRCGGRSDPHTKLQLGADVAWQCMLPPADDDRGEEVALVDQACGDRLAGEFGTANGDVAVRGLLEPRDRCAQDIFADLDRRA